MEKIVFVDHSQEVIKAMQGLSKTALRASGAAVRKILRERVPMRSKRLKNHIASWAFVERTTGQPQLQVGFYSWQKVKARHKQPSHSSPHWVEFGTAPHTIAAKKAKVMAYDEDVYGKVVQHTGQRDRHVLRNTVYENIAEIRKAQEQYLKELSGTIEQAKAKIVDSEEPEDG
jgi:hypothetical protein